MNSVNSFGKVSTSIVPPCCFTNDVAKPNFNFTSQAFCRGPERRLRATFGRVDPPFLPRRVVLECQIPSSGCASGPASWEAAKGYAREPAANVNGLTFRRISDPGFEPNTESPAASLDCAFCLDNEIVVSAV